MHNIIVSLLAGDVSLKILSGLFPFVKKVEVERAIFMLEALLYKFEEANVLVL